MSPEINIYYLKENKRHFCLLVFILWTFVAHSQNNKKHIFYIYGDSLQRNSMTAPVGTCISSVIYERIHLSKRKFIEIRHCFYEIKSEKKYQTLRDTFFLKKYKLYHRRQGKWLPYYMTYNPEGVIKQSIFEEKKIGQFGTIDYIKKNDKNIAVIRSYLVTSNGSRYYYFDPEFGIIARQGYSMHIRLEPCPINWLKLIDKKELDKWIQEYKK